MHALVVGGTGMLKKVCLALNEQEWTTSVVARDPNRMNALVSLALYPNKINELLIDWNDKGNFLKLIDQTMDEFGPFELVLYWSAREVIHDVLNLIQKKKNGTWDFYHVKGSNASRPETRNIPDTPSGCHYHEIILGFKIEGDSSRWLTNEEISSGVIEAIENGSDRKIIGTVEPWEMRPSW
jgi:hypothetical protein